MLLAVLAHQVDTVEFHIDLVFLHFFVLEFILRVVALGPEFWVIWAEKISS